MRGARAAGLVLAAALAAATAHAGEAPAPAWAFKASVAAYVPKGDTDFLQPVAMADHGALHLEGRFNYEAHDTASLWIGATFATAKDVSFSVTPIVGGVFGQTKGVAGGFRAAAAWRALDFATETEYLVDADDSAGNFLYTWSELGLTPVAWLRGGAAWQRTRLRDQGRELQWAPFLGVTVGRLSVGAYLFAPGASDQLFVLSAATSF